MRGEEEVEEVMIGSEFVGRGGSGHCQELSDIWLLENKGPINDDVRGGERIDECVDGKGGG